MNTKKPSLRKILSIISITIYILIVTTVYYYSLWSQKADLEQYFLATLFILPLVNLYYYITPLLLLKFLDDDLGWSKYFPELFLFASLLFMTTFILILDAFLASCVLGVYVFLYLANLGIDKLVEKIA